MRHGGQEGGPGREEMIGLVGEEAEDHHDEMVEVGTLTYEAEVEVGDLGEVEDAGVHRDEEEEGHREEGHHEGGHHEEGHREEEGHNHSSSISYVGASNVYGVFCDGDGEDRSLAYDVVEVGDTYNEEGRSRVVEEVEVQESVYNRSVVDDCTWKNHWKGFHRRGCMTFLHFR